MKYTITIDVEYDESSTPDPDLMVRDLTEEMQRQINEGLLAPEDQDWVVDEYEFDVRREGDDDEYPTY